jgi:hypothetical protein
MKKVNKYLLAAASGLILVGLSNCTKKAETLDLAPVTTPAPVLNTSVLTVAKGTATVQPQGGQSWASWNGGAIEPVWKNAPKLVVTGTVPDLGNGTFTGYVGNSTQITLQALYDAQFLYVLVQFNAAQHNAWTAQWYYNPTTRQWAQEQTSVTSITNLNPDGSIRASFAQDEVVMMWNISCSTFNALSCYALCHVMSNYGGATAAPAGGYMATNGPTERTDVWRVRMAQTVPLNQLNDCFIDDGASVGAGDAGQLDKNEVHSDWQILNGPSSSVPTALQSPGVIVAPGVAAVADGGFSNKQTLKVSNKPSVKEAVPIFIITSRQYINNAILVSDTISTTQRIIAVDSNGVLTLLDKSGNTTSLDPRAAANPTNPTYYQQVGTGDGPGCIPGSIAGLYTGSRGDVTANAYPASFGWQVLMKRALTTADANKNDVDFTSGNTFADLPFGIGVMFNGADNEHAIVAGLTMHFTR